MSPVNFYNSNAASPGGTQPASSPAASGSNAITKNMFLQLMVAQLKNQDPLNPADGTQFMTQLAQFQQLEQGMNTGQDITAIRQDLDALVAASTSGGSTPKS
jgi:flagellar basal-body rod modification protein FlgD